LKSGHSASETLDLLNSILTVPSNLYGISYLQAIAENLWNAFEFKYIFFGYAIKPDNLKIQTVLVLTAGEVGENFIYDLMQTPCENVFTGKRVCIHKSNVINEFPNDLPLQEMGVQSYIGAPTLIDDELFGLVAMLDPEPIDDTEFYSSLIEFIASRISVELERYTNKVQLEELTIQANTDSLTKLFNRTAFEKAVNDTIFKYNKSALLFIDADHFKKINDEFGHQKGDDVLIMLSEVLMESIREGDVVARFGGEEFVIYLPGATENSALGIATRIHQSLLNNDVHPLTVSIGISIKNNKENLDDLISNADSAVYEAKSKGRNTTVIYSN